jgi:hypothetical protein
MVVAARDESGAGQLRCAQCGAARRPDAARCWLCGAAIDSKDATRAAASVEGETAGRFSLASLMMFVTLLCVVLGVSTIAPGVGIPLGIVLLIVWLRTAAVARQRAARGLTVTGAEKLQLFLQSIGTTLALLAVICVAGCAAFFAACFACIATFSGLERVVPEQAALTFGWMAFGLVALAIVALTFWGVTKIIRRRWRRDIGEPD